MMVDCFSSCGMDVMNLLYRFSCELLVDCSWLYSIQLSRFYCLIYLFLPKIPLRPMTLTLPWYLYVLFIIAFTCLLHDGYQAWHAEKEPEGMHCVRRFLRYTKKNGGCFILVLFRRFGPASTCIATNSECYYSVSSLQISYIVPSLSQWRNPFIGRRKSNPSQTG